ncbi:MAG: hypothetical protein CMK59_04415 [Proteobacteria bacterium]|nr:hypothetical protein [Pseudomonadota bacterium]
MIWIYLSCNTSSESTEQEPFVVFEDSQKLDLSSEEIRLRIEEGLKEIRKPSMQSILYIYDQAMLLSDEACPQFFYNEYGPYWLDECISESGARFSGYGARTEYEDFEDENGSILSGSQIYGFGEMELPTGEILVLSGGSVLLEGVDSYNQNIYSQAHDHGYSFIIEGERQELTRLNQYAFSNQQGGLGIYTQGVLEFSKGTLMFEDFWAVNEQGGTACPEEYGGKLSFFDEAYGWINVYFDGPSSLDFWAEGEDCDGCGNVFYQGGFYGKICLDPSMVLNWQGSPFD